MARRMTIRCTTRTTSTAATRSTSSAGAATGPTRAWAASSCPSTRPRGPTRTSPTAAWSRSRGRWPEALVCGTERGRPLAEPPRSVVRVVLDRVNLFGLRALGAAPRGVLDPLVLLEGAEAVHLDGGVVDEDVGRAVVRGNEAVALVRVEPLHGALRHVLLLLMTISGTHGRVSRVEAAGVVTGPALGEALP